MNKKFRMIRTLFIAAVACQLSMGSASAQSPQNMSYQAVLRNSSDALVANTSVGMQVSILQGSAEGAAVYVERHFPTTNANGLVSTQIGAGTVVSGTFAAIDWSAGPYFIKTETDLKGGANYTVTGISQLLSVPYALYAQKAGTVELSTAQIESLKGANGQQGEQGPAGKDGAPGKDGANGLSAFDLWKLQAGNETKTEADYFIATKGIDGKDGADGVPGEDGANGLSSFELWKTQAGNETKTEAEYFDAIKGIDGKDGANGKDGIDGKDGANGLSAFDLWKLQAGNETKTEADYLVAVKGIDGKDGVDGKDGEDGLNGKDGANGLSAFEMWKSQAGNETKTEADYFAAIKGADGKDGLTTSVNGVVQVNGAITLTKANIDLANVDNTADIDKPISTATQTALDTKVDKESGKGLSVNDYTTAEKEKLAAITGTNTGDQDISGIATNAKAIATLESKLKFLELKIEILSGTSVADLLKGGASVSDLIAAGAKTSDLVAAGASDDVLIGREYQGGIIAYILKPTDPGYVAGETHGLIAAPSDLSRGIRWYNGTKITTGTTATELGTGNANTNTIVAKQGPGSYAAQLCADLVLNGYSDWYLPSRDELDKLYQNKVAVGGFTTETYWSSSESGFTFYYWAWIQIFSDGYQRMTDTNSTFYVRAVRSF